MTLVHLNLNSKYLSGNTDVNILLPERPGKTAPAEFYGGGKKYPVLWLLHGTFGDYSDWLRKSNIERYAGEKDLIVVMPSAQNADYANWPGFGIGYNAYDYLLEELMPLVYGWFPASPLREDNFIAGLSMGGRGAVTYSWAHPEKFAAAYSMSWVPQNMRQIAEDLAREEKLRQAEGSAPAGAPGKCAAPPPSEKDRLGRERNRIRLQNAGGPEAYLASPYNTWDRAADMAGRPDLPKTFFSCGTEDPLMYRRFRDFRDHAKAVGLDAEFTEREGYGHEWAFWDLEIQRALDLFLPEGKE